MRKLSDSDVPNTHITAGISSTRARLAYVATPSLVLLSLHFSKASDNEIAHQLILELTLSSIEILKVFFLQRYQFGNLPRWRFLLFCWTDALGTYSSW